MPLMKATLLLLLLFSYAHAHAQVSQVYEAKRTYPPTTPFMEQGGNSPHGDPTISPQIGLKLGEFEIGSQASVVLLDPSLIPSLNNTLSGELGVFIGFAEEQLVVPANLRWDFHVDMDWTVYISPGFALLVETDSNPEARIIAAGQLGGFWHLDTYFSLRAGIDTASRTLKLGAAIRLR